MKSRTLTVLVCISLAYVSGILTGISIFVLLIWKVISGVRKTVELAKTGTRVAATATRIKIYKVSQPVTFDFPSGMKRKKDGVPQVMYRLFARWQHPETGKVYTLKGIITKPDAYAVGSPVPFLVDYHNPKRHLLASMLPESMLTDSSSM